MMVVVFGLLARVLICGTRNVLSLDHPHPLVSISRRNARNGRPRKRKRGVES